MTKTMDSNTRNSLMKIELLTHLVAVADCLKGISKGDLSTAEKKIMDVLIKAGVAEYRTVSMQGNAYKDEVVQLKS